MKKLLISLAVGLGLIGAVAGAAATLTVTGVPGLGASAESVDTPLNVDSVSWSLNTSTQQVISVSLDLADSPGIPDIGSVVDLQLDASAGYQSFDVVASVTNAASETANTDPMILDVTDIAIADVNAFNIIVTGP